MKLARSVARHLLPAASLFALAALATLSATTAPQTAPASRTPRQLPRLLAPPRTRRRRDPPQPPRPDQRRQRRPATVSPGAGRSPRPAPAWRPRPWSSMASSTAPPPSPSSSRWTPPRARRSGAGTPPSPTRIAVARAPVAATSTGASPCTATWSTRAPRRPAGRAGPRGRLVALDGTDHSGRLRLHDNRGAPRREQRGRDRQRRRGVWRARLRDRLRRRDRRAAVAHLHRARQPRRRLRERGHARGRRDLDRRVVDGGRRRNGVGRHGGRRSRRTALHRHRQRVPLEPRLPQPRRRRQPLSVLHHGAGPRRRLHGLALPDHARRRLGLHGHPVARAARPEHRWARAAGHRAGAQERLLLRRGPDHRRADLGGALRRRPDVGHRGRPRVGPSGRDAGGRATG